ncbi:hypothetical protein Syun_020834 [Stephania yunnanensis]|uniref:Uncharacterized protein n=1 Tax=Stephania yunnanensis TaxID=152371 RepID=A0AAP0NNL1_9MAGN
MQGCGSYDHNLYALDYRNHRCVSVIPCGGSIYGSPSIDMESKVLYVASTKGLVTAISIEVLPFRSVWICELGAPVFGSISVSYPHGNGTFFLCCFVSFCKLLLCKCFERLFQDAPLLSLTLFFGEAAKCVDVKRGEHSCLLDWLSTKFEDKLLLFLSVASPLLALT